MIQRLQTYARFVKIEHSIFALPLIVAGSVLATGPLLLKEKTVLHWFFSHVAWILLAAVGARTVGFALNRIIDRKIDALNPRTALRELPSKSMNLQEGILVLLIGLCAYVWAAVKISPLCVIPSPLPLLIFLIYPFLKRFTVMAHFGVGLSLALGSLGGAVAIRSAIFWNRVDELGPGIHFTLHLWQKLVLVFLQSFQWMSIGLLSLFTFFWVSGFDIIYSTLDEAFDREQGLHSLPAMLGRKKALWISAGLHMLAFVTLVVLYVTYFRSPVAGVVLSATGVLLYLEHHLVDNVHLAFFKINGIISFVVLVFIGTGVAHI